MVVLNDDETFHLYGHNVKIWEVKICMLFQNMFEIALTYVFCALSEAKISGPFFIS
jgi:hypothetical protein